MIFRLLLAGHLILEYLPLGTKDLSLIHYNYSEAPEAIINKVRQIENVCEEYGVSLQAAAVQLPLAHPATATVCIGSSKPDRIKQSLDFYNESIPSEFWSSLIEKGLLLDDTPLPV